MLYLGTPSSPDIRAAMTAGEFGCMTTPNQGNVIPDGALYACDNSQFGTNPPTVDAWWEWLVAKIDRYGPEWCLWALAPDVPFNAPATLELSRPWLPRIRELGIPAAFAAQDDSEIPWGEFDVLFLAGSTEWKTGPAAEQLARESTDRGIPVHMGRVNTLERLLIADWFGCVSCDGTAFAWGPDINQDRFSRWARRLNRQPSLYSRKLSHSCGLAGMHTVITET